MTITRLYPRHVENMPDKLDNGVIYISERYRIALHNCCCGCGEEVSTPLGPTEFRILIDGDRVTVRPSIGNHDFACRSHYLITNGSIHWAGAMSRDQIEVGRAHDRYLKRGQAPVSIMDLIGSYIGRMIDYLFRRR